MGRRAVWQQTIGTDAGSRWPRESVTEQQEVTGLVSRQIFEWTWGYKDLVPRDLGHWAGS